LKKERERRQIKDRWTKMTEIFDDVLLKISYSVKTIYREAVCIRFLSNLQAFFSFISK
jgi:hypothetical protein